MKRYAHYYWPLNGHYYPSRIAVLDCDSPSPSAITPRGAILERTACYSLAYCELTHGIPGNTRQECGKLSAGPWDKLARFAVSQENTWVVMPNADSVLTDCGFWERLENGQVNLSGNDWRSPKPNDGGTKGRSDGLCVLESPPTIIAICVKGLPGKILLLDARNYGIDASELGGNCEIRSQRLLSGLLDCLSALRTDRPVSLRCTAASQAMQALRTHHPCRSLHCTNDQRSLRLARSGCFGGRCEAFRIGTSQGRFYQVDVRNMYPSLCLNLPVGVSVRCHHDEQRAATIAVKSNPTACIARVTIRTEKPVFPVKRGGITVFPSGEYESVLSGPELEYGFRHGNISKVWSATVYTTEPILAGFYRYWLAKLSVARREGKEILCQFLKGMMNALPGKFNEPGRQWIAVPFSGNVEPYDEWYDSGHDGELVRYRQIAWYTQREETNVESYNSIPSVGAFITSSGRVTLWNYIETAGKENVLYVDTDSLIVGQRGFDNLLRLGFIREGEIGHLRLVGTADRCVVYGIRDVRFGGDIRCSGVPKGDIRDGESRAQYWRRVRIKTEIAMGRRPGTGSEGEGLEAVEPYRHGNVSADGTVSPFVLGV